MTEPYLVEESTPKRLSLTLEDLVKTLDSDARHHDYMVALMIVVMAEAGFSVTSSSSSSEIDLRSNNTLAKACARRRLVIPADWKSSETGHYIVKFTLDPVTDEECKLLAIPSGDTLVVNLVLANRHKKKVFSMAVQTPKYVNIYSSDLAGRYLNLKEFSFKFKNEISTPARCEIRSALGIVNSSLEGLSIEIKLKILGMLDVFSLTRIAQTSQEFKELAAEQRIWLRLLQCDFPCSYDRQEADSNYREIYKTLYIRARARRFTPNRQWSRVNEDEDLPWLAYYWNLDTENDALPMIPDPSVPSLFRKICHPFPGLL